MIRPNSSVPPPHTPLVQALAETLGLHAVDEGERFGLDVYRRRHIDDGTDVGFTKNSNVHGWLNSMDWPTAVSTNHVLADTRIRLSDLRVDPCPCYRVPSAAR